MHLNCFFSPCQQSDVDIITVRGKYKNMMPTFDLYLKKTQNFTPSFFWSLHLQETVHLWPQSTRSSLTSP